MTIKQINNTKNDVTNYDIVTEYGCNNRRSNSKNTHKIISGTKFSLNVELQIDNIHQSASDVQ